MTTFRSENSFKTKLIRFETGERFVLTVDGDGMPVVEANAYCSIMLRGRGLMLSTMQKEMDAVCLLHRWCEERGIDLGDRINDLSLFNLMEFSALRESLRLSLRKPKKVQSISKRSSKVVANGHWRNRTQACANYIYWRLEEAILKLDVRDMRRHDARQTLGRIHEWLVGDIKVHENDLLEGMNEDQRETLGRAITPGDPSNPFDKGNQVRNQALWLLYIDAGLRRAEPLTVKTRHVRLGGSDPGLVVHRAADDKEDPRLQQPSTKTKPHRVEFSERLAAAIDDYVTNTRSSYKNAKKSPFLFISQKGQPLSISAVNEMCIVLRTKVPGLPADFSTHINRRTWNDKVSEAADELKLEPHVEKRARNQAMGWSRTSEQGARYGRRRDRKVANEIIVRMQDRLTGTSE